MYGANYGQLVKSLVFQVRAYLVVVRAYNVFYTVGASVSRQCNGPCRFVLFIHLHVVYYAMIMHIRIGSCPITVKIQT